MDSNGLKFGEHMKKPQPAPHIDQLWKSGKTNELVTLLMKWAPIPLVDRYWHWDELRFRKPPTDLTHEQWWFLLRMRRSLGLQQIPLRDLTGTAFSFAAPALLAAGLSRLDRQTGGTLAARDPLPTPEQRDTYLFRSLMDEAITSSQLEGAATTRRVATEMLRSERPPRDRGERMILNNFHAMQRIRERIDEPLTPALILDLHTTLMRDTLDDPAAVGRLRRADERIVVGSPENEIFHDPPPASQLKRRLESLCEFANTDAAEPFVHPLIRAMCLHFWLAYDHPFVDGNGRTARALFYWSALRQGYWLLEFVSISEFILKAPIQYYRAFLHTETDANDLTYFLLYHLRIIERAIDALFKYLEQKNQQLRSLERRIRRPEQFNHRQQALLAHALRHPNFQYSIMPHARDHGVVYETARTDLLNLSQAGLLKAVKRGRSWHFVPADDLEARLARA